MPKITYSLTPHPDNSLTRKINQRDKLVILFSGLVICGVLAGYLCSLYGILPFDPEELDFDAILVSPMQGGHWLGTDYMGRDTASRLLIGIQAYLMPGTLAVVIAIGAGMLIGSLSVLSGKTSKIILRFTNNLLQTTPRLVLLLLIIAIFEPDVYYIMLVIGITNIPGVANLIASRVDLLRDKSFLDSAKASGAPLGTIIFKHILWFNCRSILVSQSTLVMAEAILMETSLSYLGFGVQEPTPSWGNMIQSGANYLLQGQYWSSTIPALAIMLVLSAFYLLGNTLNRVMDRHL